MVYRGVFHAHSKHSYDGRTTLSELCAELRRRGYHFLLLTEHDDTLDAAAFERIRSECATLTNREFLVMPGIEVRCWRNEREQWHIAALGVQSWIPRGPICEVVKNIRRAGGLAVLLHPHKYSLNIDPSELSEFDGIELWNAKDDGHYAPRLKTVRLARAVALAAGPKLFCGHDSHDLNGIAPLAIEISAEQLTPETLLPRLSRGEFVLVARGMRFSATAGPSGTQAFQMFCLRCVFVAYRSLRRMRVVGPCLSVLKRLFQSGTGAARPTNL
jgi:predicted metal-dependent phosphoesterase TrpH